jgi:hypothetical protein
MQEKLKKELIADEHHTKMNDMRVQLNHLMG